MSSVQAKLKLGLEREGSLSSGVLGSKRAPLKELEE